MILADFRYLMFSFRILINFGYNILMKSTPGPEIKMPIVSDTDGALPSPAIDLVSAKSKIDPMWVLGGVLIALIAVVGIILIVEGILLEQRSPEVSLPTIVVETVAEDWVRDRSIFKIQKETHLMEETRQKNPQKRLEGQILVISQLHHGPMRAKTVL